jgi:hypothetical protein
MTPQGRLLAWAAAVIAVPAAVAATPVAPAQPAGWEPQIVIAGQAPPTGAAPGKVHQVRQLRRALPHGVGSERGLQVQTILAKRAISAKFPEVREIGGVRPDSMHWHPDGLAIDVIIPDWHSPAGRSLGDRVVEYVFANAERFGLEYVIWQRTYLPAKGKPRVMEDRGGPDANHYTHVHISTYGGGFPTGRETYYE